MRRYTLIFILSQDLSKVLLLKRRNPPYKNLWNGIGGKIEDTDINLKHAAEREILEETGMKAEEYGEPVHVATLTYRIKEPEEINIFAIRAHEGVDLKVMPPCDEGKLHWWPLSKIMTNDIELAGYYNIPHFINIVLSTNKI